MKTDGLQSASRVSVYNGAILKKPGFPDKFTSTAADHRPLWPALGKGRGIPRIEKNYVLWCTQAIPILDETPPGSKTYKITLGAFRLSRGAPGWLVRRRERNWAAAAKNRRNGEGRC